MLGAQFENEEETEQYKVIEEEIPPERDSVVKNERQNNQTNEEKKGDRLNRSDFFYHFEVRSPCYWRVLGKKIYNLTCSKNQPFDSQFEPVLPLDLSSGRAEGLSLPAGRQGLILSGAINSVEATSNVSTLRLSA